MMDVDTSSSGRAVRPATGRVRERTAARLWGEWHSARMSELLSPFAPPSLIDTAWLSSAPREVSGLTSLWYRDGAAAFGVGVDPDEVTLLEAGAEWVDDGRLRIPVAGRVRYGSALVTVFERGGQYAVRVFDPDSAQARTLCNIVVFPFADDWVVPAHFVAAERQAAAELEQFDGYRSQVQVAGWLEFSVGETQLRLAVTAAEDGEFSISFGDLSNPDTGVPFRFLDVAAPAEGEDSTVIDFNRAYLPPCTFSEYFVCPLPLPGNRLPLEVTAGERLPVWL